MRQRTRFHPEIYTPISFVGIVRKAPEGSSSKRLRPFRQIVNTKRKLPVCRGAGMFRYSSKTFDSRRCGRSRWHGRFVPLPRLQRFSSFVVRKSHGIYVCSLVVGAAGYCIN